MGYLGGDHCSVLGPVTAIVSLQVKQITGATANPGTILVMAFVD